ncbi:hypothetical protein GCM10022198_09210 [Klugiella xanthotipulae]|uniref:Regulatory LuxR family protein n=1 Tax=Klugiella xanthotipulae TaxID=244735 RepID=A0A543I6E0_9MICO|nr:AAA family ATPase [Klugiella xanthotipulae]TQM66050.1 regulatory LuxR family protein [Klugiella xanthotipulae]
MKEHLPPPLVSVLDATSETCLIVSGTSGIGKTTLLRTAARHSGLPTNWVSIAADEADWPFSGLSAFLATLRTSLFDKLSDLLDPDNVFTTARRIHRTLRTRSAPHTLFCVDDADLLDPASARVVNYLARRLTGTGLSLLMTTTDATKPTPFAALPTLVYPGMPAPAMTALVTAHAGRDIHPAVRDHIVLVAEGNPTTAIELVDGLTETHLTGRHLPVVPLSVGPRTMARVTAQQHAAAEPGTDALLEHLSTAGYTPVASLTALMPHALPALDHLERHGLVKRTNDTAQIVSMALRCAVYWGMDTATRLARHAALAAVAAPDTAEHVWHASFAQPAEGEPDADGNALLAHSVSLATPETAHIAAQFVARALHLGVSSPDEADTLLRLATEFLQLGWLGHARLYTEYALESHTSARTRLRLVTMMVQLQFLSHHIVFDTVALDTLQHYANELPDEAVQLLAQLVIYRTERWEPQIARGYATLLRDLLGQTTTPSRRVGMRALALLSTESDGHVDSGWARRGTSQAFLNAARTGDTADLIDRARMLSLAEQYDEAREIYRLLLNRTARINHLAELTVRMGALENEFLAGNFRELFTSAAALSHTNVAPGFCHPTGVLVEALYRLEDDDEHPVQEVLDRLYSRYNADKNPHLSARMDAHRGSYELTTGNLNNARRLLLRAQAAATHVPKHFIRLDAELVETLVRMGQMEEAKKVTAALRTAVASCPSRWGALALNRCLALIADPEESVDRFTTLIGSYSITDSGYDHARALSAFARRLDALNMPREARRHEQMAVAGFQTVGLPRWARALTHDANTPTTSLEENLNTEELRIADLVAQGLRTNEIASRVLMSVRSVESRLTHIYRTLGVSSRSEVAGALRRFVG